MRSCTSISCASQLDRRSAWQSRCIWSARKSPAVEEGAILLQNVDSVEIECLPDSLPSFIEVDISGLVHIHDRIHATDLEAATRRRTGMAT